MRAMSFVTLSLCCAAPALAQEQTLQAGTVYQAGTRVASPWTGVSFVVPEGFQGQYDADASGFLMADAGQQGLLVGVYAYSEATVEAAAMEVSGLLETQGVRLMVREPPVVTEDSASVWNVVIAEGGTGVLYAALHRGEPGNVIAVVSVRTSQDDSGLKGLSDGVVASAQYATPGAAQWQQSVAGGVLSSSGDRADISTGGGGTATGATDWSSSLDLCGNGQYAYQEQSETFISIEGASGSSSSSDQHMGQWSLVSDIAGNGFLVLSATDGRSFQWSVKEQGNALAIDGNLYTLARSQRCM